MKLAERDANPDLCDSGAVLHQLSYQVNWELVITRVNEKPVFMRRSSTLKFMMSRLIIGRHGLMQIVTDEQAQQYELNRLRTLTGRRQTSWLYRPY